MGEYKPVMVAINETPYSLQAIPSDKLFDKPYTTIEIPYLDNAEPVWFDTTTEFFFWFNYTRMRLTIQNKVLHSPTFDLTRQLLLFSYEHYPNAQPKDISPENAAILREAREKQIRERLIQLGIIKSEKKKFPDKPGLQNKTPDTVTFHVHHNNKHKNMMQAIYGNIAKEQLENELEWINKFKENFKNHSIMEENDPNRPKSIAEVSRTLPGMNYDTTYEDRVAEPCSCNCYAPSALIPLYSHIQHLNDSHHYSRESIAKWLDELHDSGKVNLEFEPWKEDTNANDSPDKD